MAGEPIALQRETWRNEYLALLCGIANAGGGTLTLTAPDKGYGRGIRKSFESIPELVQSNLGLSCAVEPIMMGGDLCLEISVPPASDPVSFEGTYYLYADGKNEVATRENVEQAIRTVPNLPWEMRVQPSVTLDDAEPYMVARFTEGIKGAQDSASSDSAHEGFDASDDVALSTACLKDARSRRLTNAGTLLLSRLPEDAIPGACVRIALFDDDNYSVLAQEEIEGTLLSQLESAVDAVFERYLPRVAQGDGASTPPPFTAVSEALRNALVHKDYTDPLPVRIHVYHDRITIENAGRPPATWSVSDLMGRHVSRPQNPVLAAALKDVGEFNGWGYGISTMLQACSAAGLPQPDIEVGEYETSVTFTFAGGASSDATDGGTDGRAAGGATSTRAGSSSAAGNGTGSDGEGRRARYARPTESKNAPFRERSVAALNDLNLTSTDEYVLKVLIANGRATATAIAEFIGVSESTVRRSFRKLRDYELIERIGSDKAGYWKVLF